MCNQPHPPLRAPVHRASPSSQAAEIFVRTQGAGRGFVPQDGVVEAGRVRRHLAPRTAHGLPGSGFNELISTRRGSHSPRIATPRHASPRLATPRHASPRLATFDARSRTIKISGVTLAWRRLAVVVTACRANRQH